MVIAMKFLSSVVIVSLVLCVIYGITAVFFQAVTGEELSPTLTDKWFTVFGIELLATAIIQITKTIVTNLKMRNKIEYMKQNGLNPKHSDFNSSEDSGYYYNDYSNDCYDESMG